MFINGKIGGQEDHAGWISALQLSALQGQSISPQRRRLRVPRVRIGAGIDLVFHAGESL